MHHAGAVNGGERGGDSHREAVQLARFQRSPVAHHLGQARTVHVLDDHERRNVFEIGVQHGGGAERGHLARPAHLTAEPRQKLRIGRPLPPDHLDGDPPPVRGPGEIHRTHSARAEAADECEVAEAAGIVRVKGNQSHGVPSIDQTSIFVLPGNVATACHAYKAWPVMIALRRFDQILSTL
nr:hypothetical protein GCM10020092_075270 [Actinoplanes digitatis]